MTKKSTDLANRNLAFFARYSKAYCGWLVSQSEYWKDVDSLLESGVMQDGTSICAILPVSVPTDIRVEADSDTAASIVVIHEFYAKWRLKTLATMDWPIILQPLLTPTTPYTSNSHPGNHQPCLSGYLPNRWRRDFVEHLKRCCSKQRCTSPIKLAKNHLPGFSFKEESGFVCPSI